MKEGKMSGLFWFFFFKSVYFNLFIKKKKKVEKW